MEKKDKVHTFKNFSTYNVVCDQYKTSIIFPEYFVEGMHVEVWNALGLQNELSLSF